MNETKEYRRIRFVRMQAYPHWFKVCQDLHAAVVNFYAKDSDSIEGAPEERVLKDQVPLHEATAVGSRTSTGYHQPMFDLDVPHVYVPSTTEGHGHLIFRKRISWSSYLHVMQAMADVGLLEKGFVDAARSRGEAWLRAPWIAKGEHTVEYSDGQGGLYTKVYVKRNEISDRFDPR